MATKGSGQFLTNEDVTASKLKRTIKRLCKRYFIDAFTGMAQGLFVTLIAGTIIKQIGTWITAAGTNAGFIVGNSLIMVGSMASLLMGAGIGAGIARMLKCSNLVVLSAMVAGLVGAFSMNFMNGNYFTAEAGSVVKLLALAPGNPIGAYVVSVIAIELGNLVSGKTKMDIIIVPLVVSFTAILAIFVAWPFVKLVEYIAVGIELATAITPFFMGIVIAVTMGVLLTLPTSSAAIWIAIAAGVTSDTMLLAGGAAVVGCASQMVGFAVQSFRENKWGGFIAQGIGTSMLQIPNLMRHPKIMIPPIVASAIVGPLSTCVFKLRCNATGGGMGTSGLVGIFGTIDASAGVIPDWQLGLGIALLMIIIPAVVCFFMSELMRKKGWIQENDMLLETK
ncbi:MAG: PTS sugar transporter subunit IIC [Clostridia bacterium]|nr:PTS sugar transporter subunit IIC [Clostridia bacterium]